MNHNDENPSTESDRTLLTYADLKRWLAFGSANFGSAARPVDCEYLKQ